METVAAADYFSTVASIIHLLLLLLPVTLVSSSIKGVKFTKTVEAIRLIATKRDSTIDVR